MPSAYREVLPYSRSAPCSACAPGRSQPCYSSQSPFVGSSVGGPTDARIAGKRPVPTRSGTRVAVFPSLGSRRNAPRCARTAPDSPRRVVSACDPTRPDPQLINATQSRKPKGFSGFRVWTGRTSDEVLRLHSPNALPYCAAGVDPRVGCGSTDLGESDRGLKL